jgi:squalene synthase HpnC
LERKAAAFGRTCDYSRYRRQSATQRQNVFLRNLSRFHRFSRGSLVSAGHYENFPVASFLLPRPIRDAVLAIYRFARAADDIADEGNATSAERLAAMDRFAGALDTIRDGQRPTEAPFAKLADAIARHGLPIAPFHDLLSAFRQDVTTHRYSTFDMLLDYCRRSANPIGRFLLQLHRRDTPANATHSDAICTALQLVNFWQDIADDWNRGRLYLPQEDLARFGVAEAQIAEGRCDGRWRALMAFETARARTLLESGRPLVHVLPWRAGLELSGVLAGGHRVLDRIDACRGDVFRRRPKLGRLDWALVACHALVPPRRYRLAVLP